MEISPSLIDFLAKAGAVVVGLSGLIGLLVKIRRKTELDRIREQLDVIERLPTEDARTGRALTHVFERLEKFQNDQFAKSRDVSGAAIGLVIVALFGVAGVWLLSLGGWWNVGQIVAVPLALFGLIGFVMSIVPRVRDENGNVVAGRKHSNDAEDKEDNDAPTVDRP
ncbi:hypothetical protein [Brevibacterium aurantiacum]|uniref:Uncharacterized protein n=1 Tax=Brevibacterium aurantiacum TaxID=273384 RepID=A0A3T0DCG3_BREAU|nr:hypothetical protein [Brevibacterium aurantiacum]AZT92925.1 hypothetical protein CXR23_07040 [Brevibacterium aurantiacum]